MNRVQEFPVYVIITLVQKSRPEQDESHMNKKNDLQIWKQNPNRPKAGDSPGPQN